MSIGTQTNRVPAIVAAAFSLIERGHQVEQQDVLGLWRVDGGSPVTSDQLIKIEKSANQ